LTASQKPVDAEDAKLAEQGLADWSANPTERTNG
jgi:hypothetical protein